MTLRVGFILFGGKDWIGGQNYLVNLCRVLASECPRAIRAVVFAGEDVPEERLGQFVAGGLCDVVRHRTFDSAGRWRLQFNSMVTGRDRRFVRILADNRIDVLFESAAFFGRKVGLPAIAWMPDFQHRCLPQLFGRLAWFRREIGFRAQAASGRTIMVSSEDSRELCERFYPQAKGQVRAVRFAVPPPAEDVVDGARLIADRYGLPPHYILMPNQFWRHKNHLLVIEALRLLLNHGCPITIVATGAQNDPRDPGYAAGVLAAARKAELGESFRPLGLIPRADYAPLLISSSALLNPSLFEGWSTSVEEAKSAGVPMILSDLLVHREQAGDSATYFERQSALALAEALKRCVPRDPSIAVAQAAEAAAAATARVTRFALDFLTVARETVVQHSPC